MLDDKLASFDFSPEDRATRDAVRTLVEREIEPRAHQIDEKEEFPRAGLMALSQGGFTGILFPEEYGGSAGSMLQYVIVMEEISASCAATSATYMTQVHGLLPILHEGSDSQRSRWIPPVLAGDAIAAIAITEPGAGSDMVSMRTKAERVESGFSISGSKIFITNGNNADVLSVFARTSDDRHHGISMFIVPVPSDGITFGPPLKKMGIRGSDTAEIFFDRVIVPDDAIIGALGAGFPTAMGALGEARISTAAQAVGIARRAYEEAYRYSIERTQFGRPIFEFQNVQSKLMLMHSRVMSARLMLYHVAQFIDAREQPDYSVETSMIKSYCSDTAMSVTTDAVDVLGGYGYMREYNVERFMRDAKITQIYDGTNDINRMVMARQLLKRRSGNSPGATR